MDKGAAIKEAVNGQKVRGNNWALGDYMEWEDDVFWEINKGGRAETNPNLYGANEWKLYREPKKKKTLYKWVFLSADSDHAWIETDRYYEDISDLSYIIKKPNSLKRLDYTKIEVEE